MKRLVAVATLFATVVIAGTIFLSTPKGASGSAMVGQAGEPANTITTSGTGMVQVSPNLALVSLGVQTQAGTAQAALQQNSTQMQAVLNALRAQGIADADIQTSAVSLQPITQEPTAGPTAPGTQPVTITGYLALNVVTARVRQLDKLGPVIDAAVQAGANTVEGISFTVQDTSAPEKQALQLAIQDARGKADAIAAQIDVTITGVQSVSEQGIAVPSAAAAPAGGGVPVQPGQLTVTASVIVTYGY